ncbi:transposase [Microvirga sp. 2TAF3]|uniref:transposase n=1 Tax=Microvirga sp. 2TAF3 TaxID=3233014 RepID=UPI003F95CB4C
MLRPCLQRGFRTTLALIQEWLLEGGRIVLQRPERSGVTFARILSATGARTQEPARVQRSTDQQWHLWRIRTGASWRNLPEKSGQWMMVYQRFRRWGEASIEKRSPRPLPRRWPTTPATAWIRRRFAVMSRLSAQKGGTRTSFWPFARRVHL